MTLSTSSSLESASALKSTRQVYTHLAILPAPLPNALALALPQSPQTFAAGPIAFSTLPRHHFSELQTRTFPVYFALQTALPPLILLTHPLAWHTKPGTSFTDVLLPPSSSGGANPHWRVTVAPVLLAFVASAVNLLIIGPWVARVKDKKRRVLEEMREQGEGTEDGGCPAEGGGVKVKEKETEEEEVEKELANRAMESKNKKVKALTREFAKSHGLSSALNLTACVAMGVFGWAGLAKSLR